MLLGALSNLGEAVIAIDTLERVTFVNAAASALTGWTAEEAAGVDLGRVFQIIGDEPRGPIERPTIRALRDDVVVGLSNHTRLIARDGSERPIEHRVAPIREDGRLAGAVLVFCDVSERARTEAGLRRSEAHYRALFEMGPIAIYSCDQSGVIQEFNRRAVELWGREPVAGDTDERFCGALRLLHPDGTPMPHDQTPVADVLFGRSAEVRDGEVVIERPDGSRVTVLVNIRPFLNSRGEIVGVVNCFHDITQRRRAEEVMRESQERMKDSEVRYRRLFQTAKDGILLLDATTGKIIDANTFICGLTGRDLPELLGKELSDIGMFADVAANKKVSGTLRDKGYVRYDHLPVQNTNGTVIPVEFVSNTYREGQRLVAQCNVRDISARVAMEEQLSRQAETMADQHRRKDEFLAMLSHELRNPLAPIRSATQLLRHEAGADENPIQRQAREVIERQVAILTRLVSDLLEVSRVVSGRVHMELETIDLCEIVRRSLSTTAPLAEREHHDVSLIVPDGSVWVSADATRMEQIIVNLLTNAFKFTEARGRVGVTVERCAAEAVLRVRDSGMGIGPDMLDHVFDLFAQADRSLARSQGGLGIGLSLVQRLVELHGGVVEAHSEGAGLGSEFVVRLPLVAPPGRYTAPPSPTADDHATKRLRLLVVDDNVDACLLLSELLHLEGYDVEVAHNGPDAIAAARAWRPDVMLLDIGLPGLDGFEVARRLRADPSTQNVKLLAVSGYGGEKDLLLGREAGFDAHLLKPVEFADLEKILSEWSQPETARLATEH